VSANQGTGNRSVSTLATWVSILFITAAVAAAVAACLNAYQIALLDVFRFGGTIPPVLAESQDARQRFVTAVELAAELTSMIVFFFWLYRASQNARFLGAEEMKYTPGWSVGWFFVPVAGLVMPYNVFKELWKASSPSPDGTTHEARAFPILGVWWAAMVATAVIHYSPLQVALGRERMMEFGLQPELSSWLTDHLWGFFWGRLLVDVVGIAASILTVIVVVSITRMQERRWREILATSVRLSVD
jgi:hypothetical protein